jgi:hypothetical protein
MRDARASGMEHLADRRHKIAHACARDDDRVPPPVRFLSNAEKFSAIILAELHMKAFPFDLELFRLDDAVHFPKNGAV